MRKSAIFITAALSIVLLAGCEHDCGKAEIDFDLVSFTDTDMDNVIVTRFTKGSNFSLPIESTTLTRGSQHYPRNTDTILLPQPQFSSGQRLTAAFDYEVNVVNAGRVFRITEIVEEERSEKKRGDVDCINPITSYKRDNQLVTGVGWKPFYLKK
jgi:hypothetical protein